MVIVLIAIISIVAIPRMQSDIFDIRAAAQELVEALRYAQQQSMSNSGTSNYAVILTSGGYRVTQGGADVRNPYTGAIGFSEDTAVWSGITLAPTGTVTFNAKGKPTCSGGLAACSSSTDSSANIVVNNGSDSETVTIERFTGYVHSN